jgi:Tol biopolymer transport system component
MLVEKVGERHDGVYSAMFSPDGEDILITYRQGRYQHIYRVAGDGAGCEQLTAGRRFDLDPTYSPDGTAIAFSSRRGWPRKRLYLFVMNADGSDLQQLTTTGSVASPGRFSPDGTKIVFAAYRRRGQADLFVVNVDSGELRQLSSCGCHDLYPQFLPDGETILFARAGWYGHYSPIASSDWHKYDLYTISLDGSLPRKLTNRGFHWLGSVTMSRDADCVLLEEYSEWAGDVRVLSLANPSDVRLIEPEGLRHPSLSPDGKCIVGGIKERREGVRPWYELHVMDLETGEMRQITDLELAIEDPEYSPDGNHILFRVDPDPRANRKTYELWVVNADGSNPHRIDLDIEE